MSSAIEDMKRRIMHAAPFYPVCHNDLWRLSGSPQGQQSYEFDVALLELKQHGIIECGNNGNFLVYWRER